MKEMNVLGVKVVAHNKREECLVNVINNEIKEAKRYIEENTFGDSNISFDIAKKCLREANVHFACLYYLYCTKETHLYDQIKTEFGFSII